MNFNMTNHAVGIPSGVPLHSATNTHLRMFAETVAFQFAANLKFVPVTKRDFSVRPNGDETIIMIESRRMANVHKAFRTVIAKRLNLARRAYDMTDFAADEVNYV